MELAACNGNALAICNYNDFIWRGFQLHAGYPNGCDNIKDSNSN